MSVVSIYLIFSMLAVLWYDVSRYIIPNWLVGLMLISYPVAVAMAHTGIDWKMALVGMTLVLVLGYIVFAMKWMGGGDIKLMTAGALWVGLENLPDFLFIVALLGGVFSIFMLVVRKLVPFIPKITKTADVPRILRDGEPIPYGVAIALGFLFMLLNGKVPAVL
jgi:prepilin peptidase CpaA